MSKVERKTYELYGGDVIIEFLPNSHRYHLIKDGQELPKKKRLSGVTTFTGQIDKSTPLIIWATRLYTHTVKDMIGDTSSLTKDDVLAMLESGEIAYKEKKETAATIGDYVHKFAELYSESKNEETAYNLMLQELGEPSEDQLKRIQDGCVGFIQWINDNKAEILQAEKVVYSRKQGFVGTFDAIIQVDGKKYLADYKTGKKVYPEYYYQTSAYLHAYEEETGEKLNGAMIIVIIKEDIENKDGEIVQKAGDVVTETRSRSDCIADYKAFKGLITLKDRQRFNSKWGK